MSPPLWGEREPLARARGDRRAPGRSFTPSPLSIGGGVVGWGGGVVDRLQLLIFQHSYAMVPHRVPRWLCVSFYIRDKFTPGTVSAYMLAVLPCCGLWCGLLFCASGGARFWPTMVGCGIWCFVALCLVVVLVVPSLRFVSLCWCFAPALCPAGAGGCSGPCPAACMASPRGCSGAVPGLLSYYHTTTL